MPLSEDKYRGHKDLKQWRVNVNYGNEVSPHKNLLVPPPLFIYLRNGWILIGYANIHRDNGDIYETHHEQIEGHKRYK